MCDGNFLHEKKNNKKKHKNPDGIHSNPMRNSGDEGIEKRVLSMFRLILFDRL